MSFTYCLTPEMVYGDDWQSRVPAGHYPVAFRPHERGDVVLDSGFQATRMSSYGNGRDPSIILNPVPRLEWVRNGRSKDRSEFSIDAQGVFLQHDGAPVPLFRVVRSDV